MNLLADQLFLGAPGRIHKTRELVISDTPYTVIYHATADIITILRVSHQSRQWPG
ncbi:MAG: type II toxin-antitoxin system RelE/ParE family toxin, partial [Thermodesulfobacteriota bacterium]